MMLSRLGQVATAAGRARTSETSSWCCAKATLAAVEQLNVILAMRLDNESPDQPFAVSADEVELIIRALRTFPADAAVVAKACQTLELCVGRAGNQRQQQELAAAAIRAGAAPVLKKCWDSVGDGSNVWIAATWLAQCPMDYVVFLADAGWAEAALNFLSELDFAAAPWKPHTAAQILARCVAVYTPCRDGIFQRGAVKVPSRFFCNYVST